MAKLQYVQLPGKLGVSYSKLQTLHSCPRKFKLQEMEGLKERFATIATDYGHLFGRGIQLLWETNSFERAVVGMASDWEFGIDECDMRSKRSLAFATYALEIFYNRYYPILFKKYYFFAHELFFLVHISDDFFYQGHIDLMLVERDTNKLCVWEIKTTTWNLSEVDWANSDQTGGYRVVTPFIAEKHGLQVSDEVNYLILDPRKVLDFDQDNGFLFFPFQKGYKSGVQFLRNLFCDLQTIQLYQKEQNFPTRGNNCKAFNRTCDYFGTCTMNNLDTIYGGGNKVYGNLPIEEVDYVVSAEQIIEYLNGEK